MLVGITAGASTPNNIINGGSYWYVRNEYGNNLEQALNPVQLRTIQNGEVVEVLSSVLGR